MRGEAQGRRGEKRQREWAKETERGARERGTRGRQERESIAKIPGC